MPKSSMLDQDPSAGPDSQTNNEPGESFADILSQYEQQTRSHAGEERRGFDGTVVAVTAESVLVDIGFKTEGILPLADFTKAGETVKRGDKVAGFHQGTRSGRLLRIVAPESGAAARLVGARKGVRR